MKLKVVLFLFFFSAISFLEIMAQTVTVCITINGTPMPPSGTWSMCRKNTVTATSVSSVTLAATNCATTPESNVTITWKNLSVPPNTDSLDNVIIASDTGRWEATILNNVTSIAYKDTLHLVYHAPISVTLNDGTYSFGTHGCPLSNYNLTTTTSGSISTYSWYTYSPRVLVPGATGSSHIILKRKTYYIVNASDANNCTVSDTSQYFNGLDVLNLNLGADPSSFCEGNTYSIMSTVPSGYGAPGSIAWGINNTTSPSTPPGPYTDPPAPIVVTPPAGTTKYWLRIEKAAYCANADTVVVTTVPIPIVDLPNTPLDACYGANTDITANMTLGTGPYNYTWTSVPSSTLASTGTITVSPTTNTVYTVSVTDVNNCGTATDNVTVNVNPEIFTTASPDVTICRYPTDSTTLTASATGGTGTKTYQWSPIEGLSSTTSGTIKAFPIATTTYTVTSTDSEGCTDTEEVLVTSYTPPVNANQEPQIINEDYSTTLEASINASLPTAGNNGANFEWTTSINNVPFSNSSNIFLEYAGPDTVWYVVKVTNPTPVNGSGLQCYVTDTIEIRSISNNTLMYVPNVFSPSAINPTNQTIKIYSTNILPDGFKWLIFNKWGNLMYETTNLEEAQYKGWDGGSMIEGVYSYVIVGTFKNGKDLKESDHYKGTFTLIK